MTDLLAAHSVERRAGYFVLNLEVICADMHFRLGADPIELLFQLMAVMNYRVLQNIGPPLHSKTGRQLNTNPYIFGKHI